MYKENKSVRALIAAALAAAALLSALVLSGWASAPERYQGPTELLQEKQTTVMELTAASAAVSTAITLLPGDTATPLAEKLTDLSGYFLIVLCAILLEKYLMVVAGYAVFRFLFPAALLLCAVHLFWKREWLRRLAGKLTVFGLVILLVVPLSVKATSIIEAHYETSVQEAIDSAEEVTGEVESAAEKEGGKLSGVLSQIKDGITGFTDDMAERLSAAVNRFLEAAAVMLVTSCLIPVLVLLFLVWLVKQIFSVDLPLPRRMERWRSAPEHREE